MGREEPQPPADRRLSDTSETQKNGKKCKIRTRSETTRFSASKPSTSQSALQSFECNAARVPVVINVAVRLPRCLIASSVSLLLCPYTRVIVVVRILTVLHFCVLENGSRRTPRLLQFLFRCLRFCLSRSQWLREHIAGRSTGCDGLIKGEPLAATRLKRCTLHQLLVGFAFDAGIFSTLIVEARNVIGTNGTQCDVRKAKGSLFWQRRVNLARP
mmetsp:Transcript_68833/g.80242  ORF Transcript_68833/g.80242 Transcript_68833/m.80242 type:complete len:215 (-) Transcript_68833:505-1149(-)